MEQRGAATLGHGIPADGLAGGLHPVDRPDRHPATPGRAHRRSRGTASLHAGHTSDARPTGEPWTYRFAIDIAHDAGAPEVDSVVALLPALTRTFRVLGTWKRVTA